MAESESKASNLAFGQVAAGRIPGIAAIDIESKYDCTFFVAGSPPSGGLADKRMTIGDYLRTKPSRRGPGLCSVATELVLMHAARSSKAKPAQPKSAESDAHSRDAIRDGRFVARGLACLADRGRAVSVTVRSVKPAPDSGEAEYELATSRRAVKVAVKSPYSPSNVRGENWFSIADQCNVLGRCLFRSSPPKPESPGTNRALLKEHGLVVVTGATNSAKSQITRGLIHNYLLNHVDQFQKDRADHRPCRRPHLVTFEDPIEDFFAVPTADASSVERNMTHPELAFHGFEIDYTPRERGTDVSALPAAFADALRQTPALFFVGEVREAEDWKAVLEFAGTGHLVVATAHAGSLVEAMIKLLSAVEARTPADRRRFGERILAIVHMQAVRAADAQGKGLLLPALWRRSDYGLTNLVAAGLGSVVPQFPQPAEPNAQLLFEPSRSSVGRRFLLHRLIEAVNGNPLMKKPSPPAKSDEGPKVEKTDQGHKDSEEYDPHVLALNDAKPVLERKAIELDIKGA